MSCNGLLKEKQIVVIKSDFCDVYSNLESFDVPNENFDDVVIYTTNKAKQLKEGKLDLNKNENKYFYLTYLYIGKNQYKYEQNCLDKKEIKK